MSNRIPSKKNLFNYLDYLYFGHPEQDHRSEAERIADRKAFEYQMRDKLERAADSCDLKKMFELKIQRDKIVDYFNYYDYGVSDKERTAWTEGFSWNKPWDYYENPESLITIASKRCKCNKK